MSRRLRRFLLIPALALAVLPAIRSDVEARPTLPRTTTTTTTDPVITAGGDISAPIASAATKATAQLVTSINPTVALTLGDNQYPTGSLADFKTGYGPTWGVFKGKTRPAPGNHEYDASPTAAGYFTYFGARAPAAWYSFWVGSWHVISLNSNCAKIGGCDVGSAEYKWLQNDLATHHARCTLAYWHHPRWSSGTEHGNSSQVGPFVQLLYAAGADVILNGHEHNYERFAPQAPDGTRDIARGLVEFVVGTGGMSHYGFGAPDANSLVRNGNTFGVLRMTLHPGSYDFQFRPVLGGSFTDSGSGTCH
jgi:hypothetical protein